MNTVNISFSFPKSRTLIQKHLDMAKSNVSIWDIREVVFTAVYNSSALVHVASMVHLVACFSEKRFFKFLKWQERI